ncbi:Outer membrane protein assembly factor BamB precursor [Posidoniimonas corsicana]|uniref:Outer membrane protein assembly factor BamB n=1 Tax=Posidoniimonas corsicana TaxID=1938618 RepID=A0A5C5VBM7_9BACT|nr:PQQ-binding-like beta-propeller repeat protein [Posidoniimonas corsicana]TWT35671.1 Outer membrane protein assembly factor BamB precursor [Posidoniimonas corsicana]
MKTLILLGLTLLCGVANADEWTRFRGQGGASAGTASVPSSWSVETGENIAWQVDLPGRGVSCPIVVDGSVVLTASGGLDETRLYVLAYDSRTGRQQWSREFWATGRTNCHDTSAVAANTPCSDGERVFALYSSNDLVCVDLQGNLQWARALIEDHPGVGNDIGMASSPVVAGGVVVVQCECQQNSFAAGFDAATGQELWQLERPSSANWASPVTVTVDSGKPCVLLQSGSDMTLLDIRTGEPVWDEPVKCATIASATLGGELLYVPADGLLAIDPQKAELDVLWQEGSLSPGSPSPVVGDGKLFVINRAGVLTCADATSGDGIWKKRLAGSFWATPVIAGDKLVCVNSKGEAFVVSVADGEIVGKPEFGQDISATPAVADGGMFVRSNTKLWKIATLRQAALPRN